MARETCDGDVPGVLARLEAEGIALNLTIVGLAIDDAGLKADFEIWAQLGGGTYFDAGGGPALDAALSAALEVVAPPPVPTSAGATAENGTVFDLTPGLPLSVPPRPLCG